MLSLGLGLALTLVIVPFSSTSAYFVGTAVTFIVVGVWFAILAGVWYKRREENLLWVLVTMALSWFLLERASMGYHQEPQFLLQL